MPVGPYPIENRTASPFTFSPLTFTPHVAPPSCVVQLAYVITGVAYAVALSDMCGSPSLLGVRAQQIR